MSEFTKLRDMALEKNPKLKAEYDALKDEYDVIQAEIDAKKCKI